MKITIHIEGEVVNTLLEITPKTLEQVGNEGKVTNYVSGFIQEALTREELSETEEKIAKIL